MKIIEAMKKIKMLTEKASDLRGKVAQHSADLDYETPLYADQRKQVGEWLQAHTDIVKEISKLRIAVQRTNLATDVVITLGEKDVTKSIAEWIHRRRDLADLDAQAYRALTDRGLKEGSIMQSTGQVKEVRIRRYFDPVERDNKVELYRTEPQVIDATLEVINAITDLIE